jgi:hypothetical protein
MGKNKPIYKIRLSLCFVKYCVFEGADMDNSV